jgi:hypothetical protein
MLLPLAVGAALVRGHFASCERSKALACEWLERNDEKSTVPGVAEGRRCCRRRAERHSPGARRQARKRSRRSRSAALGATPKGDRCSRRSRATRQSVSHIQLYAQRILFGSTETFSCGLRLGPPIGTLFRLVAQIFAHRTCDRARRRRPMTRSSGMRRSCCRCRLDRAAIGGRRPEAVRSSNRRHLSGWGLRALPQDGGA